MTPLQQLICDISRELYERCIRAVGDDSYSLLHDSDKGALWDVADGLWHAIRDQAIKALAEGE